MRRKKRNIRKPRTTNVTLDFGKPVPITEVYEFSDGRLEFRSAEGVEVPEDAHIETSYLRRKGPKALHRIPLLPGHLAHDPSAALAKYTWVIAVDTNSPVRTPNVAFTGLLHAQVAVVRPNVFRVGICAENDAELHNIDGPRERVGWAIACKGVVNLATNATVAIIVDSELSSLSGINAREEPLLGDYFLPQQFTLLYASSDVGADYVPNRLIRLVDRNARLVADHVIAAEPSSLPPLLNAPEHEPYTHIRIWQRQSPAVDSV